MTPKRIFRSNQKSPADRAKERKLREQLQQQKPSLQDMIRSGESDADAIMTMGMYFDVQKALQALKQERQDAGLSISDVAERSGLDRAVISRLENGKQDNPTVATLMRYAAAIGKRMLWNYENLAANTTRKTAPRRSKRSA